MSFSTSSSPAGSEWRGRYRVRSSGRLAQLVRARRSHRRGRRFESSTAHRDRKKGGGGGRGTRRGKGGGGGTMPRRRAQVDGQGDGFTPAGTGDWGDSLTRSRLAFAHGIHDKRRPGTELALPRREVALSARPCGGMSADDANASGRTVRRDPGTGRMDVNPVAAAGFGRAADAYERSRPSYPADAVALLAAELGIGPGATVLDLAAGTGKLTRLLAELGAGLVAVEPSDAMRTRVRRGAAVGAACTRAPRKRSRSPTRPSTPSSSRRPSTGSTLPRAPRDRAGAAPGGGLGLIWNERDESVPWVAELSHVMQWDAHALRGGHRLPGRARRVGAIHARAAGPVHVRAGARSRRIVRAGLDDELHRGDGAGRAGGGARRGPRARRRLPRAVRAAVRHRGLLVSPFRRAKVGVRARACASMV